MIAPVADLTCRLLDRGRRAFSCASGAPAQRPDLHLSSLMGPKTLWSDRGRRKSEAAGRSSGIRRALGISRIVYHRRQGDAAAESTDPQPSCQAPPLPVQEADPMPDGILLALAALEREVRELRALVARQHANA